MNSKTHMIFAGMTAGTLLALSLANKSLSININGHELYPAFMVLPAVIGGLGPDIDQAHSKSGRFIRRFLLIIIYLSSISSVVFFFLLNDSKASLICVAVTALSGFFRIALSLLSHRKQTHSGLLLPLLCIPIIYQICFNSPSLEFNIILCLYFGFVLGWFSHLVADSFNKRGIAWFYPISSKRFMIMHILTGSVGEIYFRYASIIVFVIIYLLIFVWGYLT